MPTYIKIPLNQSNYIAELNERLAGMCEKIEADEKWLSCFPKGGHLLGVVQLLSKHKIIYQFEVLNVDS